MVEKTTVLGKRTHDESVEQSGGGTVIDKRWENEADTEQRVKFLKELKLDSFDEMHRQERTECQTCKKSCKYYCVNCYESMVKAPKINLPCKVTVVTHPNEKKKSSIVPAKVLAKDDIDIMFTQNQVPQFEEKSDEILLLFPSETAKPVTDFMPEDLKKIKRVVLIDSTWQQTKRYLTEPNIAKLQQVKIQTEKTVFWRYQTKGADTHLATIEALYFFFRDYDVTMNCGGEYAKYDRKWDNILWFYAFQY